MAAALLNPFVSDEIGWVIEEHGIFQAYYYAHHRDADRNARDKYKEHPYYERCVHFREAWDHASVVLTTQPEPLSILHPWCMKCSLARSVTSETDYWVLRLLGAKTLSTIRAHIGGLL